MGGEADIRDGYNYSRRHSPNGILFWIIASTDLVRYLGCCPQRLPERLGPHLGITGDLARDKDIL